MSRAGALAERVRTSSTAARAGRIATHRSWPMKVVRILVAGGLLLAGAAMLVLPGPGLLVIAAGLAVLAVDFGWAARLLAATRRRLAAAADAVRSGRFARLGRRRR
jgi:hypothetical protein